MAAVNADCKEVVESRSPVGSAWKCSTTDSTPRGKAGAGGVELVAQGGAGRSAADPLVFASKHIKHVGTTNEMHRIFANDELYLRFCFVCDGRLVDYTNC